jgi:5'-nucleotidase
MINSPKNLHSKKYFLVVFILQFFVLLSPSIATEPPALTILQINDVYNTLPSKDGSKGGLARIATLKKQLVSQNKNVVLVLAGDFISPSVASTVFKGKQMIDVLNQSGLDLATLGNHEFDFGVATLKQRISEVKWQWIVSNVIDSQTKQPLKGTVPYLIKDYAGLKVAFLGLCIGGDEISPDNLKGVEILDPFETTEKYLLILKKQGVDQIIAITHLNYADDVKLAERFPEISLIIGGHEHYPITSFVNKTLISKAGTNAEYAAIVDFKTLARNAVERQFSLREINSLIPADEETSKVAENYQSQLTKELSLPIGRTEVPLDGLDTNLRMHETNLGDFVADSMREAVNADVAILNSGTIRVGRIIPAGEINKETILAIHPFGNVVCKVQVAGKVLLEALEHGVAKCEEGLGRFPQVSGITFSFNPELKPGFRVEEVKVNNQPLQLNKLYAVALTDYTLKGGDGYNYFTSQKVLINSERGTLLVSALENAIRKKQIIKPSIEGRIKIVK